MKKGAIIERVHIDRIGYKGIGIAQARNGKKILVKGALPQSIVDVKIVKKRRDFVQAKVIHVHSVDTSWLDEDVRCPHYAASYKQTDAKKLKDTSLDHTVGCGGCTWQGMSYTKQLELKANMLEDCFGQLDDIVIQAIVPSPRIWWYRNKIEFSFGKYLVRDKEDKQQFSLAHHWQMWFHKQGEFSKVIDVDQCFLASSRMHEVFVRMKHISKASGLPVYDVKTHQGVLRHLVIREGVRTWSILLNLSYASKDIASYTQKRKTFLATCKNDEVLKEYVTTFLLTENNGLADVVRGQDIVIEMLWWEGLIYEALHLQDPKVPWKTCVTRFQVSPFSFFQTNTWWAEILFTTAATMLWSVTGTIVDLYCGSGTIGLTLLWLWIWSSVVGVEIVPSAIRDAAVNARINGMYDQASFFCGKVEASVTWKHRRKKNDASESVDVAKYLIGDDVIVVDPPRDGLHKDVITFLLALQQDHCFKLLYISCNPVTMARDIALLTHADDEHAWFSLPKYIQPVDMFPHTYHVECIALFT